MKRNGLVLSLFACLLVIGGYFWREQTAIERTHASRHPSNALRVDAAVAAPRFAAPSSANSYGMGSGPASMQLCRHQIACKDDPLTPNSEAELRWMQQHGYPTKQEAARLAGLSEAQLEDEAKAGRLTAMTELGKRMIARGDNNGLSWYLRAAQRGSIYAYYARSSAELGFNRPGFGFVEAGAILRLAHMMGDHKAAYALHGLMEQYGMGKIEAIKIDRRASELYVSYANRRPPSPRPQ